MDAAPLLPDSPRVRRWRDWTGPYVWIGVAVCAIAIAAWIVWDFQAARIFGFVALLLLGALTPSMERRRNQWSGAQEREAIAELARGDAAAAAERFMRMRERFASAPLRWRLATFNLAFAELGRGDLARAVALLEEIERPRCGSRRVLNLPQTAAQLAFVHALAGNLDAARAWLLASRRRAEALDTQLGAEAVIELRGGSAERARDLLAERWPAVERSCTQAAATWLRVLRAFALERAGDARSAVDGELRHVRDGKPGELQPFTVAWPELREFVQREGLACP